jgi:hypothetical protein
MEKLHDVLDPIGRLEPCSLFKKYQNHLSEQTGPRQIALRAAGTLKPTDLAGLAMLLELDRSFAPQLAAFHQAA